MDLLLKAVNLRYDGYHGCANKWCDNLGYLIVLSPNTVILRVRSNINFMETQQFFLARYHYGIHDLLTHFG